MINISTPKLFCYVWGCVEFQTSKVCRAASEHVEDIVLLQEKDIGIKFDSYKKYKMFTEIKLTLQMKSVQEQKLKLTIYIRSLRL